MRVIATAGHVDHGKSTLVRALTGTDPDRWAEEKRRGLTLDLGFAHTTLPSGEAIAFVDVPGHVRFLANMLAGVGAVDACVLVVAATEGWKPQSEEHLRILELLGIDHGLVALTKVDAVDDDLRELAAAEIEEHLASSPLADAEVVAVGAPAGLGLDALRAALDRLVAATPVAADRGRPRLWVDRRFSARGAGTVVTGTLAGGSVAVGDTLVLDPGARSVRVRGVQTLGRVVERIGPGNRVALNVVGVEPSAVERGMVLVQPERWRPTRTFDASLQVLSSLDHDVARRGAYALHLGSGEWPVRVRILGTERLAPGEAGLVRLHLPVALPLLPGDRYVLRESGRAETVGGGEVLDVAPTLPAALARPDRDVDRVVRERGWVRVDDLDALTGEQRAATVGRWVVDPAALRTTIEGVAAQVTSAGPLGLDAATLDERARAVLDAGAVPDVVVDAGRVRAASTADPLADHPWVAALDAAGLAPPGAEGVDPAERRELVRRGLVLERDGVFFHPSAVATASAVVAELLEAHPDGVTVAQVRDRVGATRKHVVPLLAELDARGITRRRGDVRVSGPRLGDRPPEAGPAVRSGPAGSG